MVSPTTVCHGVLLALLAIAPIPAEAGTVTVITSLQAQNHVDPVNLSSSAIASLFEEVKEVFAKAASIDKSNVAISSYWFNRRRLQEDDAAFARAFSLQDGTELSASEMGRRSLRPGGTLRMETKVVSQADLSVPHLLSDCLKGMRDSYQNVGSSLKQFKYVHFRVIASTDTATDNAQRPAGYKGSSGTEATEDLEGSSDQVAKGFWIGASVLGGCLVLFLVVVVFVVTRRYYLDERNAEVIDHYSSGHNDKEAPLRENLHELNPLSHPPVEEEPAAEAAANPEAQPALPQPEQGAGSPAAGVNT